MCSICHALILYGHVIASRVVVLSSTERNGPRFAYLPIRVSGSGQAFRRASFGGPSVKSDNSTSFRSLLTPETFPVFLMFFFWGFGTGGLWLARPLFAFDLGDKSFLLVALISSVSAAPRIITGPATGYVVDRFGRKPFIILGSVLHIAALTGDFFIHSYIQFFLLEVLAGIGIAVWMTSSNALLADATEVRTRGRAIALRESSSRVGLLTGPMVGGVVAATLSLRYVFLFIALTKVAVVLLTVFLIHESRPKSLSTAQTAEQAKAARKKRLDLSMFKGRAFVALALGTIATGLVVGGTGVFRTLFPPHAKAAAGLSDTQVGDLISIAGVLGLIASFPAGMANDRFGRKRILMLGLAVVAVAVYLMSGTTAFAMAVIAVVVFGIGEAMSNGTVQVYAMDLAPESQRGAFLGVWSLFTNIGQITGPVVVGAMADSFGFTKAFIIVGCTLIAAVAAIFVLGVETAPRHGTGPQPSAPESVPDASGGRRL